MVVYEVIKSLDPFGSKQKGLDLHRTDTTTLRKYLFILLNTNKGKAVPLQARNVPEGSRKLSFPDFLTTAEDGDKVVSLTHRPLFTPRKYSWYSFLLEAESTTGPWCDRKVFYVNEKSTDTSWDRNSDLPICSTAP